MATFTKGKSMKKYWVVYRNANYAESDTYYEFFDTKEELKIFVDTNRRIKNNQQPHKIIEALFFGEMLHEEEIV